MEVKEKLNLVLVSEDVKKSIRDDLIFIIKVMPEIIAIIDYNNNQSNNLNIIDNILKDMQNSPSILDIRMSILLSNIVKYQKYNADETKESKKEIEQMVKSILTRLNYDEKFVESVIYQIKNNNN